MQMIHYIRFAIGAIRALALSTLGGTAVFGMTGVARALGGVPEIDPGSLSSAICLLAAGTLLLTDKIRRKV